MPARGGDHLTRRPRLALVSAALLCLASAHVWSGDGPSEIGIIYQGNTSPENVLDELLAEYGSEVTDVVLRPEGGGYLVSVTKPDDPQTAENLMNALGGAQRVSHVESNVCYEFYPDNIRPENERTLTAPPAPNVEQFISGDAPPWTAEGLQASSDGRQFRSTTERGQQLATQTRRTVGWSMVRDPGVDPPIGTRPPPIIEYDTMSCEAPTNLNNKAPNIKVKLNAGAPGQFLYPRPLPLQAIARDYDEVQFGCGGCAGEATNERLFIEEAIGLYDWKLAGKGSLNQPYKDLEDDLQSRIDDLKKQIRTKSAELEEAKAAKAELDATRDAREKALDEEIARLEEQLAAAETALNELTPKVNSTQAELDTVTQKLQAAKAEIERLQKEIDRLNEEIKELEDKINGKPSAATQDLAQRLEALEQQIEAKQAEFERLKLDNTAREQALAVAYDQAINNLVTARQNLANARQKVVAKQNEILALENRLYSNPALLDTMLLQSNITRLGVDLQNRFLGGGAPATQTLAQLAQQVFRAPNPGARQNALDAFNAERNQVLTRLSAQCSALSQPTASECAAVLSELSGEAGRLAQTLSDALTNPTSGGSAADWQKLDDLRDELKNLEGEIAAAEQQVSNAEQGVATAQRTYTEGLNELQQREQRAAAEIADLQLQAQELSAELTQARARDEEERLLNTPDWLEQIAEKRLQIEKLEGELAAKRLEAEIAQADKDRLEVELRALKNEQDELQGRIAYLKMQLEQKRQEKAKLADETKKLEDKIKRLESEIKDLEEQLKNLLKAVTAAAAGNLNASGQQVFFIPPPLEHTDGFDKTNFEKFKEALAEKEAAYEKARAAKAQLQDDAYKILKGFTEQLWALKAAKKTVSDLEGELKTLNDKKSKRQTDVAQERSGDVAKEIEKKGKLTEDKTTKDSELSEASRVEEQDKRRLGDREGELKEATSAKADAERNVASKRSALEAKDQQRRAKHAEQSSKFAEFQSDVTKLKNEEAKLSRAKSALSRAAAANDATAQSTAQGEVNRAKAEIERLNTSINNQRGPLQTLDQQYATLVREQEQAQNELDNAEEDLRDKNDTFWDKVKLVKSAQDDVRESMQARLSAEREVRKAEDAIKRQDEQVKQAQEEADKAVDEDKEVKDTQKEIDDKEGKKAAAEQEKNKALNKLAQNKIKKTEWDKRKTAAETELQKARDERDGARKDLKDFLQTQFKNVRHTATLDLTIMDAQSAAAASAKAAGNAAPPAPPWRSADDPRTFTITISYQGDGRQPTVTGVPEENLKPPEPVRAATARCQLSVGFVPESVPNLSPAPIQQDEKVGEEGLEPQTIALYFDKGAPLYDLWPPVPEPPKPDPDAGTNGGDPAAAATPVEGGGEDAGNGDQEGDEERKILVRAATPFTTGAQDQDELSAECMPAGGDAILVGGQDGGGAGQMCTEGGSSGGPIDDVPHAEWKTETYTANDELTTMIIVPKVKPEQCEGEIDFDVGYRDSRLQYEDNKSQKHIYKRAAGEKGDAPARYDDFGKANAMELRFQVYEGGHNGKSDQTVEWKIDSLQPASIENTKYGLDALGVMELKGDQAKKTDGSGYSKVNFLLEERWALAKVTAEWKRGETTCAKATMEITRPLQLRKVGVGSAPQNGWEQGKEAWQGNDDFDKLSDALEGDGPGTAPSLAVGLLDDWLDPVDDKKIAFSIVTPDAASMKPTEVTTEIYGLAWSFAQDVPEESAVKMKADVEAELTQVTEPPSQEGERSTKTENRFQIGPEGKRFTIETDEPFVPGEVYSGGGKLVISGNVAHIPLEFKRLELQAEGVVVDDDLIATEGSVSWNVTTAGGEPFKFTVPSFKFEFTLATLGLTAGSDGNITGKVKIPTRDDEVEFSATFGPEGFIGRVSNFPEIELAKLKLEKGAEFVVDMHNKEDPEDLDLKGNWRGKGLVLVQASLLLPESLKGDAETPPKISVKNLFYNSTGLNGAIEVDYSVAAKLGKVEFAIEKVAVEFQANELHKGEFGGKMTLADPFHGNISAKMSLDREGKYSFEIGTDKPVTAPSLGLTLNLRKVAGEYDQGTDVFTFELEALLRSKTFSEINVNQFKVKSTGDISADVELNLDMQFGKGFDAHIGSFKLEKTDTQFSMSLNTVSLKFNEMLEGEVQEILIAKGPKIEKFTASIKAEKEPVSFAADINYEADVFEGSLKVKVEKVMEVDGTFILGTQKQEDESEFVYWYVELNSKVTIPLGPPPPPPSATGLAITKLGGGIGYNYDPPIGQAPGAVRKTDTFSLKAAVTVGNFPGGEIFAGRLTMVLVSGRFSVNGKVWVLDRESSLFGEGQLDLYWKPAAKLEGFVRMLIALPGTDGKLVRFSGQVDFKYAGNNDWFIKSRTLEGALLEQVIAEGNIDIKPGSALLDGNVRYDLSKSVPLAVVTLQVQVNLRADGKLEITVTETEARLNTELSFRGDMDVTLETKVRNFDLARVSLASKLALSATNRTIAVRGTATVSWDTWVHSGSHVVDIGYTSG